MYTEIAIKLVDDNQVGRVDVSRLTSSLVPCCRFSVSFSSEFRD